MTEIRFYHLQQTALEAALPKLLEKVLERDWRAVVMTGSAERVQALNTRLWTYGRDSFLPHGTAEDGNAALQPIWLTHEDENPNEATVLFLVDGAESGNTEKFDLCCTLFDGNDEDAVSRARARWRQYKDQGHELTYWQQNDGGQWEEKSGEG
ncbi:MAG: DNA polymerase III subunit chi [Rhodospirillaceae bacterium]|nr:DNA polymerase III subunit chi [Rhodospirillaceae bacterium]